MSGNPIRLNKVKSPGNIQQDEHQDLADAKRVILVDEDGNEHNDSNPVPVEGELSVNLDSSNPGSIEIQNVNLLLKNVEYSIVIPEKTIKWRIRARNKSRLQWSLTATESSTNYWTVIPGNTDGEDTVFLEGKVLYIQASKDNEVVEFRAWTQ
jgi:hypothetical protein